IIASTSALKNIAGGFVSQSTVGLVPTFEMQTDVHFTVNRPVGPALTLVAIANDLISASNTPYSHQTVSTVLPQNDPLSAGSGDPRQTWSGDNAHHDADPAHNSKLAGDSAHHSHDEIFADDADWLTGSSH